MLKPKVVGDFLRQYDGAALPADPIAKNVLLDKGVPRERVDDVLALVVRGAESVGFLKEIQGRRYVDLVATGAGHAAGQSVAGETGAEPPAAAPPALPVGVAPPVGVTVGAGVHVNIEIHIAADASSETIEDIFRNMRRYVLSGNGSPEEE